MNERLSLITYRVFFERIYSDFDITFIKQIGSTSLQKSCSIIKASSWETKMSCEQSITKCGINPPPFVKLHIAPNRSRACLFAKESKGIEIWARDSCQFSSLSYRYYNKSLSFCYAHLEAGRQQKYLFRSNLYAQHAYQIFRKRSASLKLKVFTRASCGS